MKILFAGGGTAGHINPGLAIANQLRCDDPSAEILFVGTKRGMEKDLVPKSGYKIEFIDIEGFRRKLTPENVVITVKTLFSINQSKSIIKKFKPDVVVGTGGYVSGPVLYAAAKKKIPTLIHEQNAFPGVTSKILKRYVDIAAISFPDSKKYFEGAKKIVYTGNPLRGELFQTTYKQARKNLGLGSKPFIVVMGGSLGARNLNKAVIDFVCRYPDDYQVIISLGENDYQRSMEQFEESGINLNNHPNIQAVKYIYNSAEVLAAADLMVIRGGAVSISEACALGKPSIIVPSPNVVNNHQEYNAKALETEGAAVMVADVDLPKGELTTAILRLMRDKKLLSDMAENAARIGTKDSTGRLCEMIKTLCKLRLIK